MALTDDRPATYADIDALPANMVGQILYGALHAHPRLVPIHARLTTRIDTELEGPFDGAGGAAAR